MLRMVEVAVALLTLHMRMIFFMNVDRRGEQTVEGQLGFVPPRKLCTDREQVGVLVGREDVHMCKGGGRVGTVG